MKMGELLAALALGALGGFAVAVFGFPGLLVISALGLVGIVLRRIVVVLACGISAGVMLALWTFAVSRCEQTAGRTCTVEGALLAMFVWAGVVLVIGLAATWALVARSRPH